MPSKNRSSEKRCSASTEIMAAAKAIATLKGEDLAQLEAQFFEDYVHNNLHILTQKALAAGQERKKDMGDA